LLEECRLDPDRPPSSYHKRKSDQRVSTTDPDAALMKPRVSDESFATLTEAYAHRCLVPIDTASDPLAYEEAPTTVYRTTALQRRVPKRV
jgi:hypothetical protein